MDQVRIKSKVEEVPRGQRLLDDMFLLMALGLGVPLVLYIIWSVVDVLRVPVFKP